MNAYMCEDRVGKVVDVNAISSSEGYMGWNERWRDVVWYGNTSRMKFKDMHLNRRTDNQWCNKTGNQSSNMGYYITWKEHYLIVKFPNSYRPYKNSWMISWFLNTEKKRGFLKLSHVDGWAELIKKYCAVPTVWSKLSRIKIEIKLKKVFCTRIPEFSKSK